MPRMRSGDIKGDVNLGGRPFSSFLPTEPDLSGAWMDPVQSRLLDPSNPELGARLQKDAVALIRDVAGRMAVQTGVPTQWVPQIDRITTAAISQDWLQMARGATLTGIDIGFKAIGAVPIVGWIAQAAAELVFTIVSWATATNRGPLPPPLVRYSKSANEDFTNSLLLAIGDTDQVNPDWTPLFRPPAVGKWVRLAAHGGYVFQVAGSDPERFTALDGFGLLPDRALGVLQLNVNAMALKSASFGIGGFDILIRDVTEMSKASFVAYIEQSAYDKTELLQSGIRTAVAAWQAVKTKTAAMYNIDTRYVADEWRNYIQGGLEIVDRYQKSKAKSRSVEQNELDRTTAFAAQALLYDWKATKSEPGIPRGVFFPNKKRLDVLVKHSMLGLRTRQIKTLKTLGVAYCSERQAAFKNLAFHGMLIEHRKLLLRHRAVQNVRLEDVVDADFRAEVSSVQRRGAGFGFKAEGVAKKQMPTFPGVDKAPGGEAWPTPVRSSLFGPLVGLGLVGGLGYGAFRYWKRKR